MTQASATPRPFAKPAGSGATVPRRVPYPQPAPPDGIPRRQVERGLAEGRRLHGEAMRAGFRTVFNWVFKRRSARGAGFGNRHQAC